MARVPRRSRSSRGGETLLSAAGLEWMRGRDEPRSRLRRDVALLCFFAILPNARLSLIFGFVSCNAPSSLSQLCECPEAVHELGFASCCWPHPRGCVTCTGTHGCRALPLLLQRY